MNTYNVGMAFGFDLPETRTTGQQKCGVAGVQRIVSRSWLALTAGSFSRGFHAEARCCHATVSRFMAFCTSCRWERSGSHNLVVGENARIIYRVVGTTKQKSRPVVAHYSWIYP